MLYVEIAIVVALVCVNGLLSMSELAIVSSRPARLKGMIDRDVKGAGRALALGSNPGKFLSSVQIGITLVGVLSEHGKGNALDVMSIELNNGDDIDVRKPGLFAFRTRGFLNNVRADGCQYFTTVLGPGYNYDHRNHFHFDLAKRRNGRHACH